MRVYRSVPIAVFALFITAFCLFNGCKTNDTPTAGPAGAQPITVDLFPLVAGHTFIYTGYAINTTTAGSTKLPDPLHVYRTAWTVGTPVNLGPFGAAVAIIDTTTLQGQSGLIGKKTMLFIRKDSTTGDFSFLQTLGPFFRAFGINSTDTARWVAIARPSVGLGGTWVAFDSTFTSAAAGAVRLQINGIVVDQEDVMDSSAAHTIWHTYKFKTARAITAGSNTNTFLTSELWLVANVGPVQVHIAEDTENIGHFRVLIQKLP
ncbi:MAG: hypothetical protein ACHQQQ_03110 [Bacteroidota bacterium]